ncbi:hypothetical protein A2U01_0068830, partial [Trifolium medium]|nr:hypothetical protein [Trifolium medium]
MSMQKQKKEREDGALRRSCRSNRISLWHLRVAQHGMARHAVESGNATMSLWKLRVAQ